MKGALPGAGLRFTGGIPGGTRHHSDADRIASEALQAKAADNLSRWSTSGRRREERARHVCLRPCLDPGRLCVLPHRARNKGIQGTDDGGLGCGIRGVRVLEPRERQEANIIPAAGIAGAGILALASAVIFLLSRRIIMTSLRSIITSASGVAQGDLTVTVPEPNQEEIGHLGTVFNTMIQQLSMVLAVLRPLQEPWRARGAGFPRAPRKWQAGDGSEQADCVAAAVEETSRPASSLQDSHLIISSHQSAFEHFPVGAFPVHCA